MSQENTLPAGLAARLNGDLQDEAIVGWSEHDLDGNNRFSSQLAVLTDTRLLLIGATRRAIAIASIDECRIIEGLGVDRLAIIAGGKLEAELRYSRRHRTTMTRLHRKLERRLPKADPKKNEARPDWLDAVEREAEKKELCPKCGLLIPTYAEGVCPRCIAKRRILWRLMDVAKPYRKRIWFALFLTICLSAISVIPARLNKAMIDTAIDPKIYNAVTQKNEPRMISAEDRVAMLLKLGGAFAATIIVTELIGRTRMRILAWTGTTVTADLRHLVYAHMHELSLRYFAKRRTGSLITRVTNDTDRLWDFIVFGSVDSIRNVTMIIFIATLMFLTNWRLAFVSLIPLPLLGYLTYVRGMKMQKMFGRLWTYWSRLTAVVGDALPGVRVVKAFANEDKEIRRFDRRSNEYTDKEQEIHIVWTSLQPIVSGLMRISAMIIWIAGGYLIIRHPSEANTLGTLVMFSGLNGMFYGPIMELANSNRMVTRAATSAQRIFEVLDTPPEIYSRQGAAAPEKMQGKVEFRHVSFSYEGAQPALRDVSMVAEPGEMIGLCGPSGAGKSTFVNLICRFYDVTDGQILIDGVDVRDYDVKYLRRAVGMVLQEPYLFHGTISDNIRYGNADATDAQVITAARAANAHDFIVGFPDGYDTMVGERGQSLSGGERQRISIARAILHNPRILILDEATSSVDTETERQIQQALDRLVEGRTTFAIAHRLSTLTAADRLVVLDKGTIAEQGKHDDLVNKEGGVYAKLHKTQVEMNLVVAIR